MTDNDPFPWIPLMLALWPLWAALGTIAVLGTVDWLIGLHVERETRRGDRQ